MRLRPIALCVLVTFAPFCLAAAPAPKPSTTPATAAPAATVEELRTVYQAYVKGMYEGDDKATFRQLFYASEDAKKEAQAIIGEIVYQRQLDQALDAEFKANPMVRPGDKMKLDQVTERIAMATATVSGDAAELKLQEHSVVSLVRDQGVWKIDFHKTQRAHEGAYDKDSVAEAATRVQALQQFAADVKAHKFKTRNEATKEWQKRQAAIAIANTPDNPRVAAARHKATIAEISNLKMSLEVFEIDNGRYPTTNEGLVALVERPAGLENSWRKLLDDVPVDKWGHDYLYEGPDKAGGDDFNIISAGADGKYDTADDIDRRTQD